MSKAYYISAAFIFVLGAVAFFCDAQKWVSEWPGYLSVGAAYGLAVIALLENAFPNLRG